MKARWPERFGERQAWGPGKDESVIHSLIHSLSKHSLSSYSRQDTGQGTRIRGVTMVNHTPSLCQELILNTAFALRAEGMAPSFSKGYCHLPLISALGL